MDTRSLHEALHFTAEDNLLNTAAFELSAGPEAEPEAPTADPDTEPEAPPKEPEPKKEPPAPVPQTPIPTVEPPGGDPDDPNWTEPPSGPPLPGVCPITSPPDEMPGADEPDEGE